jgi:taurine dioxygenase
VQDYSRSLLDDSRYRKALRRLLGDHQVLVFPQRQVVDIEEQLSLASVFGVLEPSLEIDTAHPDSRYVQLIERDSSVVQETRTPSSYFWHADRSFLKMPPSATILYASRVAEEGGATLFANTRLSFMAEEPSVRDRLVGLKALHSYGRYYSRLESDHYSQEEVQEAQGRFRETWHDVLREDPYLGEVSPYLSDLCIEKLNASGDQREIRLVLSRIHERAKESPYVYSHSWQPGDIVVWNNIGLMHRGSPSVGVRKLRRCVVSYEER